MLPDTKMQHLHQVFFGEELEVKKEQGVLAGLVQVDRDVRGGLLPLKVLVLVPLVTAVALPVM